MPERKAFEEENESFLLNNDDSDDEEYEDNEIKHEDDESECEVESEELVEESDEDGGIVETIFLKPTSQVTDKGKDFKEKLWTQTTGIFDDLLKELDDEENVATVKTNDEEDSSEDEIIEANVKSEVLEKIEDNDSDDQSETVDETENFEESSDNIEDSQPTKRLSRQESYDKYQKAIWGKQYQTAADREKMSAKSRAIKRKFDERKISNYNPKKCKIIMNKSEQKNYNKPKQRNKLSERFAYLEKSSRMF